MPRRNYEQLRLLAQDLPRIALQADTTSFENTFGGDNESGNQRTIAAEDSASVLSILGRRRQIDDILIGQLDCPPSPALRSYQTSLWRANETVPLHTARVCRSRDQQTYMEWSTEAELALDYTHSAKDVVVIGDTADLARLDVVADDIVCSAEIGRLFSIYAMWRAQDLRKLCLIHHISVTSRDRRTDLFRKLLTHVCDDGCSPHIVTFTTLSRPRTSEQVAIAAFNPAEVEPAADDGQSYLDTASESLRTSIIREWQDTISTANMERAVCGPCGRLLPRKDLSLVELSHCTLSLLRNDAIPPRTRPTNYAFDLYERALLDPRGMTDRWTAAPLVVCGDCRREWIDKSRMPRLCLANWLYYAHDTLPPAVGAAFDRSSQFDRMLVSRARASRISFRFTEVREGDPSNREPIEAHDQHATAQRYIRGNVLVMPQNSTQLNSILPPPPSVVHDTACAVFVGTQKPTMATIGGLSPVLVRRTTISTIIQFLVSENPYYVPDGEHFFGFSPENLDALLDDADERKDTGVPCAMDIGFVSDSDALRATTADYTGRNDIRDGPSPDSSVLMENVGYTCGDKSPVSYRDMKLRALSHCLNGGRFVRSQAGDTFVPDFHNPALLAWLFPHLDPWGIGGFHHPDRSITIGMEEQLRYLLQLADGRFQRDPDFAFVYFNILQKKAVCDSVHFRVKETEQRRIVDKLLAVDRATLEGLIAKYDKDQHYVPDTAEESELVTLVNSVGTVMREIPGTSGYKLNMRNEIRSLVNFHGTPAFFITLNPSDVNHPLVRLLAGDQINLEDASVGEELTEWRRRLLVARNPGACAMFFHTMISTFISVVLRYGRPEPGLFGRCTAYYGTVEAQARGTLHCHMLIWIKDHPSPQKLRDLMIEDDEYQARLFEWLENVIKCEPLGTTAVVPASSLPRRDPPPRPTPPGFVHPGTKRLPRVDSLMPSDFRDQYHQMVNELVNECNWHDHTETCWKYLRRNQPRTDANCRMRMDGTTHERTDLDPDTMSIRLRRLHPWIASYNDLVIFLLQANMDIKHIGSGEGAKALIFYITDYITKASIPAHLGLAALLYALDRTESKYNGVRQWTPREQTGALNILVNSMLSRQEISHQQVMSHLVGGGDHYTSHIFRLLHYRTFERTVVRFWYPERHAPTTTSLRAPSPGSVGAEATLINYSSSLPPEPNAIAARGPSPPPSFPDAAVQDIATDSQTSSLMPAVGEASVESVNDDLVTLTLGPGSISALSQQQDYLLRPTTEPFTSMPLYQFVGMTEKMTCGADTRRMESRIYPIEAGAPLRGRPQGERGSFQSSHPQYNTHLVRKRMRWVVPVILNNRLPREDSSPEEREVRFRTIMTIFLPWRTPADLKHPDESWASAYDRRASEIVPQHRAIIDNMTVLTECKDARDRAITSARGGGQGMLSTVAMAPATESATYQSSARDPSSTLAGFPIGAELDGLLPAPTGPGRVITVDDIISAPARVALDRCFQGMSSDPRERPLGKASAMAETDKETVGAQHTAMQTLKRKRRPSPVPDIGRAPQRRRPSNAPPREPAMDVTTLGTAVTPNAGNQRAPHAAASAIVDPSGIIRQVVIEFKLLANPEQLRAFRIVARHICFGGPQLLMYVAGVGGTGKSHVVKAILRLFDLLGRAHQVLVSAPTGAAAILIGGYTIHSLLLLPDRAGVDLQPLVVLWAGVLYLIVDEVSMISANFMSQISMRLQHAKGTSGLAEDTPFGGVNILFFGDFGQLRPVGGAALYSHRLIQHPNPQEMQATEGVAALKGAYLWNLVHDVVVLRRNQRQIGDHEYSQLLARIRSGTSGNARAAGIADDFATLQSRLLQNFDTATLQHFRDAPVLVGIKTVRDPLNDRILRHHAARIGAEVQTYHSHDRVTHATLTPSERETLWALPSTITKDALGKLPLYPGMKVMVQENIAFACRVVNGAIGTVRDIKYTEEGGLRFASVVYVHIPGSGRYFGPDHDDVIPIFPVPSYIRWEIRRKTATTPAQFLCFTRLQLPLLPAYVFTDYKGQGRTLDLAIVDPDSALTIQGVYVMLSRVRNLDGLAILHPFRRTKVEGRISQQLRDEFSRLDNLDRTTRLLYEANSHLYA